MGWRDEEDDDDYDDIGRRMRERSDQQAPKGSAALGISSLSISFVAILGVIGLFAIAVAVAAANNGRVGPRDPAILFIVFGFIACMLLTVVGIVLGGIGAFSTNATGMTCAIIGGVLNAMTLFGLLALMCIGALGQR
ncbi:MAG: hypothetical protein HYR84_10650 [Planctomycetes bacterium]|nr:hypothetical protein [Planctomycetota bacterium]